MDATEQVHAMYCFRDFIMFSSAPLEETVEECFDNLANWVKKNGYLDIFAPISSFNLLAFAAELLIQTARYVTQILHSDTLQVNGIKDMLVRCLYQSWLQDVNGRYDWIRVSSTANELATTLVFSREEFEKSGSKKATPEEDPDV
jgi:hypothetical protein